MPLRWQCVPWRKRKSKKFVSWQGKLADNSASSLSRLLTRSFFLGKAVKAIRAGNALFVLRSRFICFRDRMPTAFTAIVGSCCQSLSDGDTLVEDKTLTLPETFLDWDFLQILENAAFEVIHLLKALIQQKRGGFFTANTTRTKQGDLFM